MAAINAAGYDADVASSNNSPLRKAVRDYLSQANPPIVGELKRFFEQHRQKDSNADLSQYISYALSVDGPPNFKYRFNPNELPPDVAPLEGLSALLTDFYKDAHIEEVWKKSQPVFDKVLAEYQPLAMQGITQVNAYLRNPTSGSLGRRFQIYIDLLGAPNQIHTRSYKDDFFIVLTASKVPQADEVRHAYLHYLVDPLVLRHAETLDKKRSLFDFAQGAPALDQYYKDDYSLFATESLIKAIEARLTLGAAKKQDVLDQATREGFILAPGFADGLIAYEKQDQALRFYFKEMAESIDLHKEAARLDKVQFARERVVKTYRVEVEKPVEPTGVFKTMADAENFYKERLLDQARESYMKVLKQPDQQFLHARSYYGLARIAALQSEPELAERMFLKTVEMNPDDETRAWCFVYLGRLAEARDAREEAVHNYQKALGMTGISVGARKAAEQGLKEEYRKK